MDDHDPETGRFVTGNNGGPGRPRGSKNKFTPQFWDDLAAIWEVGGKAALERVFHQDATAFVRVAASMMPKEQEHKHSGAVDVFTWRDRELTSRMSPDLGSEDSTTEANESPLASAIDAAAKPTLQ